MYPSHELGDIAASEGNPGITVAARGQHVLRPCSHSCAYTVLERSPARVAEAGVVIRIADIVEVYARYARLQSCLDHRVELHLCIEFM